MTYVQSDQVLQVEVADMPILMHGKHFEYMEFNLASAAIWRLLRTPQTLTDIVTQLRKQFRVEEALCREDTEKFVEELVASEYLETRP